MDLPLRVVGIGAKQVAAEAGGVEGMRHRADTDAKIVDPERQEHDTGG
jgi:hypothetical protein